MTSLREAIERSAAAQRNIDGITGTRRQARDLEISKSRLRRNWRQIDGEFAKTLRETREAAGLSQSRLAAFAGYDHSYVSRLESDSRAPTRDAVLSLTAAMGCDDAARDRLLITAGFMPIDPANTYADEPELQRIAQLLADEGTAQEVRRAIRAGLKAMVQTMRYRQVARESWEAAS